MYLALSGNVLHRQLYHWIGLFIALLHLKTGKKTYTKAFYRSVNYSNCAT